MNTTTTPRTPLSKQTIDERLAHASVPIQEQWELSGFERLDRPTHCLCGHRLKKFSFTIRNTQNGNTLGPIGSGCITKIGVPLLTDTITKLMTPTTPPKPKPTKRPVTPTRPFLVAHCTAITDDPRYQMCSTCKPKCMRAGLDRVKTKSGLNDTFDNVVRTNPRVVEWLMQNHYQWDKKDTTDPYYKMNGFRRAYAINELTHHHPEP